MSSTVSSQKLYAKAKKEYQNLLFSKSRKKYRSHWIRAIRRFQKVMKRHPRSSESYKAAFTLGRLYQDLGRRSGRSSDIDRALLYYRKLESNFPPGVLTDDALYFSGQIHLKRKNYSRARHCFRKLVQRYPKGDFVPKARRQLRTAVLKRVKPKTARTVVRKAARPKTARTAVRKAARPQAQPAVVLKDLTFVSEAKGTRIVLEVEGNVKYSKKRLGNPDRVYFDFHNARWDEHIPAQIPVHDGLIEKLRLTNDRGRPSRLVVDLKELDRLKVGVKNDGNRLEILIPNPKRKFIPVKTGLKNAKRPNLLRVGNANSPPASKKSKKRLVVVIDAGHGGKDYGATGRNGLM
ncbi:MAG: AMIN domain-containing protein, partial [Nitrospinaceae bacterium]|nr:AMIN domain-containing protein [Nitrospinaceae bacterium]NIT81362.1 AMIN domain-containing protein [Nitrospinaceae bacterium]NIU95768.1 AMIN domain-containing protein [Nitrospinaceae bacterium]NIW58416.1 AMIN domain-containing protein [Nitrospinaceae bacterium]